MSKTQEQVEKEALEAGWKLLNTFEKSSIRCQYQCLKCDYITYILPGNVKNKMGCKKCANLATSKRRRLPKGQSGLSALYCRYKNAANNRKYSFNLTKEQFKLLILSNCFWCQGTREQLGMKIKRSYDDSEFGPFLGIDRLYNKRGYEVDNSVPCCTQCNLAKSDYTLIEWIDYLMRIKNGEFMSNELVNKKLELLKNQLTLC